jgi:uncharacterized protein
MRWIAYFEDHAGREWIRKEHAAAHFDYLASERDKIRLSGLWIMADPYFKLGLRKGYRLLVWGKAPCYEAVTL